MARSNTGSSANYLQSTVIPVSDYPFTMHCWLKLTGDVCPMQIGKVSGGGVRVTHHLETSVDFPTASDITVDAWSSDNSNEVSSSYTFTGVEYTDLGWFTIGGVWASATSRVVYGNGVAGTEDTTSRTFNPGSVLNAVDVGILHFSSGSTFKPLPGSIADAAIWSAALTANEMAALARGVNPLRIRPASLVRYWPIWGLNSPEDQLAGGSNRLTVTGSMPYATHAPRVLDTTKQGLWTPSLVTPTRALQHITSPLRW